jgi:hypothetical protein
MLLLRSGGVEAEEEYLTQHHIRRVNSSSGMRRHLKIHLISNPAILAENVLLCIIRWFLSKPFSLDTFGLLNDLRPTWAQN